MECPLHQLVPGTSTGREVVAIGDYTAQYSDELTFCEGEIIQILKEGNKK